MENTAEGRELLEYVAKCAFDEGDSLVVKVPGGAVQEFPGLLGLAPAWESRALDRAEQELISACLLAHVNAYGVSVPISIRADGKIPASDAEIAEFSVYEGSFFGQVFAPNGKIKAYACQGDDAPLAHLLASSRELRVCTDATPDCGITAVGRCRDVCEEHTAKYGWRRCTVEVEGSIEYYEETTSTFLRADADDRVAHVCPPGQSCSFGVPGSRPAFIDCADAESCDVTCAPGSSCVIDGAGAEILRVSAARDAAVQVDCLTTGTCSVSCSENASCEIDCKDAGTCSAECADGADCLLDCTGTAPGDCQFSECPAGAIACEGDIIACGRACP